MSHTLLLADDSETTQRVVALIFAERDVQVVSVSNGQQALERLSAEPPDIVLAAISLSKVGGYQIAEFMQRQPPLRTVPVLLLSGAFDVVDEERVRQSGASGVLVKPFESELVINRVKELLGFGDKPKRLVTPPGGRLFPQDMPPHRPSLTGPRGAGAPAARPDRPGPFQEPAPPVRRDPAPNHAGSPPVTARVEPPAPARPEPPTNEPPQLNAWDQLREETGLGPDAAPVEAGNAGGADDYFERLDAAFDNLDAQLSARSAARAREAAPTTKRTTDEISTRRMPVLQPDELRPPVRRAGPESPYEDLDWFNERPGAPVVARPETPPGDGAASPAGARLAVPPVQAVDRPEGRASDGETSPVVVGADAPPSHRAAPPAAPLHAAPAYAPPPPATYAAPPRIADAFDHLFAAEQGEAHPPADAHGQGPLVEIPDDAIERIASRVAERLSEGVLVDRFTEIVTAVSERLVRQEIARIRASAQTKDV